MSRFQILEVDSAENQRSSLEAAEPDKGSAASLFVAALQYQPQHHRQHQRQHHRPQRHSCTSNTQHDRL